LCALFCFWVGEAFTLPRSWLEHRLSVDVFSLYSSNTGFLLPPCLFIYSDFFSLFSKISCFTSPNNQKSLSITTMHTTVLRPGSPLTNNDHCSLQALQPKLFEIFCDIPWVVVRIAPCHYIIHYIINSSRNSYNVWLDKQLHCLVKSLETADTHIWHSSLVPRMRASRAMSHSSGPPSRLLRTNWNGFAARGSEEPQL